MPTFIVSQKKQENSIKYIYLSFIGYAKPFVWITTNWKILKEMGIPDHHTCLLRKLYASPEYTDPDKEQMTGSELGKE